MSEEWKPPYKMSNGDYGFDDWRPIRNAIEAAYTELGQKVPKNIDKEIWNLVGLSIHHYSHAMQFDCAECRKSLRHGTEIRCLDCKAVLCEQCAPRHFWPNGRPR